MNLISFGNYKIMTVLQPSDIEIWTDIKWYVLKVKEDKALLMSKDCLLWELYDADNTLPIEAYPCPWEKSYLREILNGRVYEEAFTDEEKRVILPANALKDKMYLLDMEELDAYFPDIELRKAETIIADDSDGRVFISREPSVWWINSVGSESNQMSVIHYDGTLDRNGMGVYCDEVGVRPVIWVETQALAELKRTTVARLFGK